MTDVALTAWSRVSITRARTVSWALHASVMLLAVVAPFERALPGPTFGFTITTAEAAIAMALAAGITAWLKDRRSFEWRTPITAPLAAIVFSAVIAAALAPELRGNALRVAARLAVAALLFLLVMNVARPRHIARQVAAAILGAGAIVGVIALLELAQVPWVLDLLKGFRPGFHVVGGQLRATSTLLYPTIASMFLEVAFALGLMFIGSSRLAFVALIATGAGVIATFTRAGLITMSMSLLFYGAVVFAAPRAPHRLRRGRWSHEHTRLSALAGVLLALVFMSRSPQMLAARISAEGSQEWYGAAYEVPQRLTLRPDSFNDIAVTLRNQGRLTWQSSEVPPFALSYHWLSSATEEIVIFDGLRTPFSTPVEPGEEARITARVRAPSYPGTYVLIWDVVQEHRTWLSLEGVFPGRSIASVEGPAVGAPLATKGRMPSSVMRMPRSVLWRTALQIWTEHPLLGIGPDNFRHIYGRYLGLGAWDSRVHANNSYIEVLVGMGLAGAAALGWLIVAAARSTLRLLSRATEQSLPLVAAATAACLAIAAHALVDSFLTFTSTYVTFAIAAGLLYSTADHAHRV